MGKQILKQPQIIEHAQARTKTALLQLYCTKKTFSVAIEEIQEDFWHLKVNEWINFKNFFMSVKMLARSSVTAWCKKLTTWCKKG